MEEEEVVEEVEDKVEEELGRGGSRTEGGGREHLMRRMRK